MLAAATLALSLLGSPGDAQVAVHVVRAGAWTVKVRSDRFTGETACTLDGPGMTFHRDTLVFRLGRAVDSSEAFFRIDEGPAHSVREPRLQNETHGFFLDSGPIDNPSGGRVALPFSILRDAKRVLIRASPRSSPRAFDLSGFPAALAAAKAAGCKDETF